MSTSTNLLTKLHTENCCLKTKMYRQVNVHTNGCRPPQCQ